MNCRHKLHVEHRFAIQTARTFGRWWSKCCSTWTMSRRWVTESGENVGLLKLCFLCFPNCNITSCSYCVCDLTNCNSFKVFVKLCYVLLQPHNIYSQTVFLVSSLCLAKNTTILTKLGLSVKGKSKQNVMICKSRKTYNSFTIRLKIHI